MRLVDADEMRKFLNRQYEVCHGYMGNKKEIYREALRAVKSYVHSETVIDAVEVVRCCDCKQHDHDGGAGYCNRWGKWSNMSDFCSYGDRKDVSE
ncbi:MAG: hypothetical protein KBT06_08600 [Prevotellaceae bacterium]|nr:hypothetical protein [Candidatus Colivivens equi]